MAGGVAGSPWQAADAGGKANDHGRANQLGETFHQGVESARAQRAAVGRRLLHLSDQHQPRAGAGRSSSCSR